MEFKQQVQTLLDEAVAENQLFVVDWSINAENEIQVFVDGIKGANIAAIMAVSRHIEHNMDREQQDFSLEVSSPGLTKPFVVKEQYIKNKGKKVEVKCSDDTQFEGVLEEVAEDTITLTWKSREPKPIGKGKHTVSHKKEIPFSSIQQAKVVITI